MTSPINNQEIWWFISTYIWWKQTYQFAKGKPQIMRQIVLKILWLDDGTIYDLQEMLDIEGCLGVEMLGRRDLISLDV